MALLIAVLKLFLTELKSFTRIANACLLDRNGSVTMFEIQLESGDSVYGSCINYIGNIMTCLEEGVLDLPEPGLASNFLLCLISSNSVFGLSLDCR